MTKYWESRAPTAESIYAIDYSRRLVVWDCVQGIRHTDGVQARMEPHKVLPVVSSDIGILVVYGDERPHEKESEIISTVPGRDRTGSLQETFADPTKCDHDGMEKSR